MVPDLKKQLPGRGVWITAKADYVAQAVAKGLFSRAFKSSVLRDDNLVVLVGDLLARRCLDYLGMARKAGLLAVGFANVAAALKGDVAALVAASDGARDGRRKLAALAGREVTIVTCFNREQLSLALGRPNVVHAAVDAHRLGDEFLLAVRRAKEYIR